MQDYISKIQNWRKTKTVIHSGKLMHFVPEDGVYTYFRYNNDEAVMVMLNKNETEKTVDTKRFSEIMDGYKLGREIITSKEISSVLEVKIPAKTAMIIELMK
jgi:neopullulanase